MGECLLSDSNSDQELAIFFQLVVKKKIFATIDTLHATFACIICACVFVCACVQLPQVVHTERDCVNKTGSHDRQPEMPQKIFMLSKMTLLCTQMSTDWLGGWQRSHIWQQAVAVYVVAGVYWLS